MRELPTSVIRLDKPTSPTSNSSPEAWHHRSGGCFQTTPKAQVNLLSFDFFSCFGFNSLNRIRSSRFAPQAGDFSREGTPRAQDSCPSVLQALAASDACGPSSSAPECQARSADIPRFSWVFVEPPPPAPQKTHILKPSDWLRHNIFGSPI